jgi:hypothetical protein
MRWQKCSAAMLGIVTLFGCRQSRYEAESLGRLTVVEDKRMIELVRLVVISPPTAKHNGFRSYNLVEPSVPMPSSQKELGYLIGSTPIYRREQVLVQAAVSLSKQLGSGRALILGTRPLAIAVCGGLSVPAMSLSRSDRDYNPADGRQFFVDDSTLHETADTVFIFDDYGYRGVRITLERPMTLEQIRADLATPVGLVPLRIEDWRGSLGGSGR